MLIKLQYIRHFENKKYIYLFEKQLCKKTLSLKDLVGILNVAPSLTRYHIVKSFIPLKRKKNIFTRI